jgi:dCMP deaminase
MYLEVARAISRQATCKRGHFGAVVVKDDIIIGTGFNGPARGVKHCRTCKRRDYRPSEGYHLCPAVHAEANAVINAGGRRACVGATLYIDSHNRTPDEKYNSKSYIFSCDTCARTMVNAGIEYVVYRIDDLIITDHLPTLVAIGGIE